MEISIAIDGPAGAGKSTIAKLIAKKFGLMYVNTGAMYRAVTLIALKNNIKPAEVTKLCELVHSIDMHFENDRLILNGVDVNDEIIKPYISNNVSNYAAIPEVREVLVGQQRKIANKFNVVMDGRDIGNVVLKDAPFKFFLTASAEKRALRRYNELKEKGIPVNYDDILKDIINRDYIDTHRETNPLFKSVDAIEIDSSDLTVDEVVQKMILRIEKGIHG